MKISNYLGDAVAFVWDWGLLLLLGAVSAVVLFRRLPSDEDDPVADDYDPGAIWDRAYDREIDRANGVV